MCVHIQLRLYMHLSFRVKNIYDIYILYHVHACICYIQVYQLMSTSLAALSFRTASAPRHCAVKLLSRWMDNSDATLAIQNVRIIIIQKCL